MCGALDPLVMAFEDHVKNKGMTVVKYHVTVVKYHVTGPNICVYVHVRWVSVRNNSRV